METGTVLRLEIFGRQPARTQTRIPTVLTLAHHMDLGVAPAGALQQAGNALANDEFRLAVPRVAQHALDGPPVWPLVSAMRWLCLPLLCVFGRHGLARATGPEPIHNPDVDNLASYDVKSPPAVQIANVLGYQRAPMESLAASRSASPCHIRN